jgi:hypothetical protein
MSLTYSVARTIPRQSNEHSTHRSCAEHVVLRSDDILQVDVGSRRAIKRFQSATGRSEVTNRRPKCDAEAIGWIKN